MNAKRRMIELMGADYELRRQVRECLMRYRVLYGVALLVRERLTSRWHWARMERRRKRLTATCVEMFPLLRRPR